MPPPLPTVPAVRIIGTRKFGSGHQYQVEWQDQSTTWEAASKARKEHPALVQAYEQQHAQQVSGNDAARVDLPAIAAESAGVAAMREQMIALEQLVRTQQAQARAQERQIAELTLRASSTPSGTPQTLPSPSLPAGSTDAATAPAVPSFAASSSAPAPKQTSRFEKKEPRAQDLKEYDGASGAKLEEWLQELSKIVRLFSLNGRETVEFGMARLSGAADQWSLALNASERAALVDGAALGAALRSRFQPRNVAELVREQLDHLTQGARGINDYIADYQRLRARLPDMGEADALHAFRRGLRADLQLKVREHNCTTVQAAVELTARIGGLPTAASQPPARPASARQMDMGDDSDASLDERIQRAVLNAMQSSGGSSGSGLGAKTQTQRGYANERGGGQRGRGRGVRFGGAQRSAPTVPGVPEEVVRRRLDAQQCVRCGEEGHRSPACPNAISASGK